MSRTPIGARVGAILSATQDEVQLLGYGVYDGEHEPPFGPFGMPIAEFRAEVQERIDAGTLPKTYKWTNPRITLDDGRVVWGAQCWWGPESVIQKKIDGRRVVQAELPNTAS